jgi:glycosyl transferase family 2
VLSVVITAHRDELGLYLILAAARVQLERLPQPYEIIVVADGGTEQKFEKLPFTRVIRGHFGSPQASRDAGIRAAVYPTVLLLESHVVVSDIQRLVVQHEIKNAALTFPCRVAEGSEMFNVYGQRVDWNGNLWHKNLVYQPHDNKPYRVAQFGHSCFCLDRSWYIESGGYTNLMIGWGAEEPFLALKAWMLGRECWLIPDVWHAHYLTPGAHADAMSSANYRRNFDILKYVITGQVNPGFVPDAAVELERQRICRGPFKGDVNLLRRYFEEEKILA